jgi:hypothetical protein
MHRAKLKEITGDAPKRRQGRGMRANRQGCAENGLFAPNPQEQL